MNLNHQCQRLFCSWCWETFLGLSVVFAFTSFSPGQNSSSAASDQAVFKPVPDQEGKALPFDAGISGEAQPPASPMAWWDRSPATKFWEGLPIGTGRFAAVVYDRVRDEIIPFNDETLWTGQPNNRLTLKPDKWYRVRMELIGNTVLAECNGVTVHGTQENFCSPITTLALGSGYGVHDFRCFRIYEARPNPKWIAPASDLARSNP
jgi:hypothetical protein